jgi:hypothetical protein
VRRRSLWGLVVMVMAGLWWSAVQDESALPSMGSVRAEGGSSSGSTADSPQRGVAPPGRGRVWTSQAIEEARERSPSGEASPPTDRAAFMNGEVIALVAHESGEAVDGWFLLSDDCSVRAPVHEGRAMTLSPPGECRFRVSPSVDSDWEKEEWTTAHVIGSETIFLDFVVSDSVLQEDSGA